MGVRRHGETSVIAEVMTRERGRHLGLVRNGRSRSMQPVLQPGNLVEVTWRARLDEHLGNFAAEPVNFRAATLMEHAASLHGVQALAALLRLLPERDPHPQIHAALEHVLDALIDARRAALGMVRFELQLLAELGFGLDLSSCAVSGAETDLVYVSPKSGRAVSRQAGEPWREKLLALPAFLRDASADAPSPQDISDGFALTGFFLARHVLEPRNSRLADARASFIAAVLRDTRPAVVVG